MTTQATTTLTRGQLVAADVSALLRARNPLLWIVTREEARVERFLFEAAAQASYVPHTWDCAQGTCNMGGRLEDPELADLTAMLAFVDSRAATGTTRDVWIMRDLHSFLNSPLAIRPLRNLTRILPSTPRNSAQAVIVISPSGEIPPELAGHATVIEWPLPDRAEIAAVLDNAVASLPEDMRNAASNGVRELAIDSAVGLSGEEAAACYARSLIQLAARRNALRAQGEPYAHLTLDPAIVASEKKRVIARERVLEWYDPLPGGMDSVGGLENLKAWLAARKTAYSPEARAYGLPAPRGAMLVGISGCGKSLTAKAIATAWKVPLLRVDLGALKSKFVGESEGNLRKAFAVIESVGRCVVWFDEVEKALAGSTGPQGDGGVSSDALGAILSWMQERKGEAFVIATANDVSALPPEFLRKGRFDEVFWIDLPNVTERAAIVRAALRTHGRGTLDINAERVSAVCDGFTGSEVAALIPDALFIAFADSGREISTSDLLEAAESIVPLSKTAGDKINAMRQWAVGKARPASAAPEAARATTTRQIDL